MINKALVEKESKVILLHYSHKWRFPIHMLELVVY